MTLATQPNASLLVPTPDGTRVVFVADRDVAGREELYVVPLDGSSAPMKLSGSTLADGDVVGPLVLTPDGSRALYRADLLQDEVFELFTVPVDGSGTTVRVSAAMVAGGDVALTNAGDPPFTVTPDGQTVLYRADQENDFFFGLYAAPVDGSSPPVRVHPPLASAFGVESGHFVLEDSSAVLYRANFIVGQTDLWISSLDGTRTRRLSYLDTANSDVEPDFQVVGEHVYYRANQRVQVQNELFRSELRPTRKQRAGSPGTAPSRTIGAGR